MKNNKSGKHKTKKRTKKRNNIYKGGKCNGKSKRVLKGGLTHIPFNNNLE